MAKHAAEIICNGLISSGTSYDSTRFTVGSMIKYWSFSGSPVDKWMGPPHPQVCRTSSISNAPSHVDAVKWDTNIYWIFYGSTTNGTSLHRTVMCKYDSSTNATTPVGYIISTNPPGAGSVTPRGFRVVYTKYTTGTVAVSGTAVTGTSTSWNTDKMCVGYRIGFGSTVPANITTWYEISAIGSDTSITLTGSAGTISAGASYVIEELMIVAVNSNSTGTNSGLFVTKGLRYESFAAGGTTIPAATTTDRIRACYWLKDASTITSTAPVGVCMEAFTSYTTEQFAYMVHGTGTNCIIYKMNIRATLTPTSGAQVLSGADLVKTGTQAVTGSFATYGSVADLATTAHGPGSGVSCIYFSNGSRIYRVPAASVTTGSTSFLADNMTEVPPGGTSTHLQTSAMGAVRYLPSIDRFIISTNSSSSKSYVTTYQTSGNQFELVVFETSAQSDGSSSMAPLPHIKANQNGGITGAEVDGYLFSSNSFSNGGADAHVLAIATDWTYAADTGQRLIFPEQIFGSLPAKFYRVFVNHVNYSGGSVSYGRSFEPFRIYYRTGGISDNSGSWILCDETGDLTSVSTASSIQFMIEFRVLSDGACIPSRINGVCVVYETNDALPSQYMWNLGDSSSSTGTFGFIQVAILGAIGLHTINIYRADTNALVLTQDDSSTTNGDFEYWNGSAWIAGLGTDVVGTRRRFVPSAGLPSGIDLYATLTIT